MKRFLFSPLVTLTLFPFFQGSARAEACSNLALPTLRKQSTNMSGTVRPPISRDEFVRLFFPFKAEEAQTTWCAFDSDTGLQLPITETIAGEEATALSIQTTKPRWSIGQCQILVVKLKTETGTEVYNTGTQHWYSTPYLTSKASLMTSLSETSQFALPQPTAGDTNTRAGSVSLKRTPQR